MKKNCTCKQCGKQFHKKLSAIKNGKGKFCSLTCYNVHRYAKVFRKCRNCGKEFWVIKARVKQNRGFFCSRKCGGKWQSKYLRGNKNPSWRGGKVIRKCKMCGDEIKVRQDRIKDGRGKFCSKKCMQKYHTGANAPNWHGGISFEPYGIEFNLELKERIRKRDGYICQMCADDWKQIYPKLHVHHIDYDKRNNREDNLISLCKRHHMQTNRNRQWWIDYFLEV